MTSPEQAARRAIDGLLEAAGWQVQDRKEMKPVKVWRAISSAPSVYGRPF